MARLIDDLNALHDRYVESVNLAVADDDLARAHRLASEYDEEASALVAAHDGPAGLRPIRRPEHAESGLRALVRRLTARAA